jgi:hypothetical protein
MIENLIEFTDLILQIEGLPPVEVGKLYKNRLRCYSPSVKIILSSYRRHVIKSDLCYMKMSG